jgi:hypothetical protein
MGYPRRWPGVYPVRHCGVAVRVNPLLPTLLLLAACGSSIGGLGGRKDTGDAEQIPQTVLLSATELDFGDLPYGTSSFDYITLSNAGTVNLIVSSITVDSPFSVEPQSVVVAGGASTSLKISVTLSDYGDHSATLVIASDDEASPETDVSVHAAAITDVDGDGYPSEAAGGTDCDDGDIDVYPGAPDEWYDGEDSNCDGLNDYDADSDGYETDAYNDDPNDGGGDCLDNDPDSHPGAEDEPYDNKDANCDGLDDYDYDQDGSRSDDYGKGTDCDDYDATINVDGVEAFNGKDDDCDGYTDLNAYAQHTDTIYNADGNYDRAGYSLAIGDLDADGESELVVGSPYAGASSPYASASGGVSIFQGGGGLKATGTDVDKADNFIDGDGSSDYLGVQVAVLGDYDGDGVNELAMYASGASSSSGMVYLVPGDEAVDNADLGDTSVEFTGTTSSQLGRGLGTDIDLNGDGQQDLVAMYTNGSANYFALDYGGSHSGSASINSMDARFMTDGTEAAFYRNAPVGGDFDGDGLQDLVLSDGMADYGGYSDNGAIWVLWGKSTEYSPASGSTVDIEDYGTVVAYGASSSAHECWATQLGEDWDADGDGELWVYNSGDGLYVVEGGTERRSAFDVETAAAVHYSWGSSTADAEMIRQTGDWTGDGVSDMMVFLEDSGDEGENNFFSSEVQSGSWLQAEDLSGSLYGDDDYGNANVGYGMPAKGGDVDGDGDADFAVGDPEFNSNAGEVYLLLNEN